MTPVSPLRIRGPVLPAILGLLLYALCFPAAAQTHAPSAAYADISLGLTAGVAIACAAACALAWAATRNAMHGAGLAFMLVEGVYRATPALLPPGALQAGSYAALLALTVPALVQTPGAGRLATVCRWVSTTLATLAALRLVLAYGPGNSAVHTTIAGACSITSVLLAAWFLWRALRGSSANAAMLAMALAYAVSAWVLASDAGRPGAAAGAHLGWELLRLLLVTGALLLYAMGGRAAAASAPAPAPTATGPAPAAGTDQLAQGELRLAELAGALDTQRQMNALISHELRAPLATISAAAQSLDMILADGGDATGSRLARIHRSVSRMTELMDQLLNQDRLGEQAWTPRGESADLAALARDVVASMQPDTAHALILEAESPLPVYCDRPLTCVVVRNLIHNAIKYSPANQPVRIETGLSRAGDVPMAWVAVTDRGPGIGEEEQARIFEPHFRRAAHRETQGLGIGLYLARRICQNQGGSLTMQSTVGVGTRFVVTLPSNPPPAQAANT